MQRLFDLRVGVEDALAAEQLHGVEEVAARADGRVDLEAVPLAGQEVVGAVAGRGVDDTRALLERDVIAEHANRVAVVERMAEARCPRGPRPSCAPPAAVERLADRCDTRRRQPLGDDDRAAVHVVGGVVELGVERDRQVRRHRPRRRRPDEDRHVLPPRAGTRGQRRRALGSSGNST